MAIPSHSTLSKKLKTISKLFMITKTLFPDFTIDDDLLNLANLFWTPNIFYRREGTSFTTCTFKNLLNSPRHFSVCPEPIWPSQNHCLLFFCFFCLFFSTHCWITFLCIFSCILSCILLLFVFLLQTYFDVDFYCIIFHILLVFVCRLTGYSSTDFRRTLFSYFFSLSEKSLHQPQVIFYNLSLLSSLYCLDIFFLLISLLFHSTFYIWNDSLWRIICYYDDE